jgi:hypothetical protein
LQISISANINSTNEDKYYHNKRVLTVEADDRKKQRTQLDGKGETA